MNCPQCDSALTEEQLLALLGPQKIRSLAAALNGGGSSGPDRIGVSCAGSELPHALANMAILHLMIGLPCSGKTTYARQLAGETNALLLTLDVWHLKLFGDDSGQHCHDERHERVEKIMWDVAKHVLAMGGDVILDYGCWARVERDDYRNRAKELGADFKLHYMDVPYSELYRRLEERNRNRPEGAFEISKAEMDRYITIFQPPTRDELV